MSDRKKDIVKQYLRDHLVRGCYRFGERISAKAISEETSASRFMVITALNELRAEGFLEITAQVGVEVVRPTLTEITDFFVVFGRLEGAMAEFAATRRSTSDVVGLRHVNGLLHSLDPCDDEAGERYRLLNLEFHQAIHAAARSPRLAENQFMHWAMADFLVTQASDFKLHIADSAIEHDSVVSAIDRQDPASARVLMETHIYRLGDHVVANLRETMTSPERPIGRA